MSDPVSRRRSGARGLGRRRDRRHGRRRLRAGDAVAQGHAAQMALMAAATHPRADRRRSCSINGFARFARADDYPAGMPSSAQEPCLETDRGDTGERARSPAALGALRRRPAGRRRVVGDASSATRRRPGMALAQGAARSSSSTCVTCSRSSRLRRSSIQSRDNAYVRVGPRPLSRRAHPRRASRRAGQRRPLAAPDPGAARCDRGVRHGRADATSRTPIASSRPCSFVDIVGSTEQASALGDRRWSAIARSLRALRARGARALRRELERHRR